MQLPDNTVSLVGLRILLAILRYCWNPVLASVSLFIESSSLVTISDVLVSGFEFCARESLQQRTPRKGHTVA